MRGRELVLAVCVVASVSRQLVAGPPKPPPDIQAILDKKKHGGTLTVDDIRRLQEWASGVTRNLPTMPTGPVVVPSGPDVAGQTVVAPGTQGVPVRFDMALHYTRKSGSQAQTFDITAWAPLEVVAKMNGTGDYAAGVLDPNASTSSFLFAPPSVPAKGAGTYRYHATSSSGQTQLDARLSDVSGGLMLVTTGGDTLGVIPGSIAGEVTGTYHEVDSRGKASTHEYRGAEREALRDQLFPWEGHVTKDRTKPTTHPRAQISYRRLSSALQSGKTEQITVNEHFDWNDHGEQVDGTVDLTITVRPLPVIARIVPSKGSDWESWLPEGPTPKNAHGNTFGAHLELVDATTNKPWTGPETAISATYDILEVTHLPGICGNWPKKGAAEYEERPDLFFSAANKTATVTDPERQLLDLDRKHWNDTVLVEARDFAAWGRIAARVKLSNGVVLDASFAPTSTTYITLPRDQDLDHIADAWSHGQVLEPLADDEDTPGFRTRGDGFTVMEEYRGFLVSRGRKPLPDHGASDDEEHKRFDPKQRELIVAVDLDPSKSPSLIDRGISIFEKASGIAVYAVASRDRLGPHANDPGVPRGVVLNATPEKSHSADLNRGVVGVWISSKLDHVTSIASTVSFLGEDDCEARPTVCMSTPASVKWVAIGSGVDSVNTVKWITEMVDPDPIKGMAEGDLAVKADINKWYRDHGVTDAERAKAAARGYAHRADLAEEMSGFAIAHELGHTVGALHHGSLTNEPWDTGELTCPMRYWHLVTPAVSIATKKVVGLMTPPINAPMWLTFLNGTWNPMKESPNGPAWTFCEWNRKQMGLNP